MALFEGKVKMEGTRSNTALVKSGHMSPAQDWLLDPVFKESDMSTVWTNGGSMFVYEYGGPGMTDVVIPKGRILGCGLPVKDFVSKQFKSTLTLPGLARNKNVIGVAPMNVTRDFLQEDRLGGNPPSIITLDYIRLPYMPGYTPSTLYTKAGVLAEELEISIQNRNPWGSIIGTNGSGGFIQEGDYVKATPSGRFCWWDPEVDGVQDIVGQVLATELNAEPWGWLKWVLWDKQARNEDDVFINRYTHEANKSGTSNLPSDNGWPYDPQYVDGNNLFQSYQSNLITNPTGIPGLHDGGGNYSGYGQNDTEYKCVATLPADGSVYAMQLKDYAGGNVNNINKLVSVKIDGTAVADLSTLSLDTSNGILVIPLEAGNYGKPIEVVFTYLHFGTNAYLDFKGVIGEYYVLLKR